MADIIQYPHDTLRTHAAPVSEKEFGTRTLRGLVDEMNDALSKESEGVALAAPQINVSKQIFVVSPRAYAYAEEERAEEIKQKPLVFINPEITKQSKRRIWMSEGCLSVRNKYGEKKRSNKVTVRAQDKSGAWFTYNASGLLAQIFQHEIDHLNGILFIDDVANLETILSNENPGERPEQRLSSL